MHPTITHPRTLVAAVALLALVGCSTGSSAEKESSGEQEATSNANDSEAKADEADSQEKPELKTVAKLDRAPGNITVTPDGEVIVSLHQFYQPDLRVGRITSDGELVPFPNEQWSLGGGEQPKLDAVLGIQSTPDGVVWMLDNGLRNGKTPKLVGWDTDDDELEKVIELPPPITADDSFVNDLAVDTDSGTIYVSDPAGGSNAALLVVDIASGDARRLLEGHRSVTPDEELDLVIDGTPVKRKLDDGSVVRPHVGANPIALDSDQKTLYYGPMHGETLYRMPTEVLRNSETSADELHEAVETHADKPICDGISVDNDGRVYISDLADNAVGVIDPDRNYRTLASDDRLEWPDAFAFGPDGSLYTVANQLHKSAFLNAGEDESSAPFYVFKLDAPGEGVVGR